MQHESTEEKTIKSIILIGVIFIASIFFIIPQLIAHGIITPKSVSVRDDLQVSFIKEDSCVINIVKGTTREEIMSGAEWCANENEKSKTDDTQNEI